MNNIKKNIDSTNKDINNKNSENDILNNNNIELEKS